MGNHGYRPHPYNRDSPLGGGGGKGSRWEGDHFLRGGKREDFSRLMVKYEFIPQDGTKPFFGREKGGFPD